MCCLLKKLSIFALRTFDETEDENGQHQIINEHLLSSLSQGGGIGDFDTETITKQDGLQRSRHSSFKRATADRYNFNSFDIENPSFDSTVGTVDDYHHTSIDSYSQGKTFASSYLCLEI